MKDIKDATVTELKAECFDREQAIKIAQSQLSQVYKLLEQKIKEEQTKEVVEDGNKEKD